MKKWLVPIVCVALSGVNGLADGIEFQQSSFPAEEYVLLTMSENQVAEIEKERVFSLSKSQLAKMRAAAPTFPKKVGVASPFVELIPDSRFSLWPGKVTGIWCSRNTVAIPRGTLHGTGGCRGFNTSLSDGDAVLIDTAGGYSIGSKQVDVRKLTKSLDALAVRQSTGNTFSIFVLRPPVLAGDEEQAIQRALDQLETLCAERGIQPVLGG